jgi:hypothetical protein
MDGATATIIERELYDQHGEDYAGLENAHVEVQRALRVIPESENWMIAKPLPAVYVRDGKTLFLLTVLGAEDRVRLISRKIVAGKLGIALEWGESIPGPDGVTRTTKWTFRIEPDDGADDLFAGPKVIEGHYRARSDGTDACDHGEAFARSLANLAGWSFEDDVPRIRAVG